MTVSVIKEASDAAQLVAHSGGRREWVCPYHVTVTSPNDDAQTIVDAMAAAGRGLNNTLTYGSRTDALVWCSRVAPVRNPTSPLHWLVTCTYETPPSTGPEPTGEDGQATSDPLDWRYKIQTNTAFFETAVWNAWNIDPFPRPGGHGTYARPANTLGAPVNSAGVPFDPPLTRQTPESLIRIVGYMPYFDSGDIDAFVGHINGRTIQWHPRLLTWYGFLNRLFPPYTVLCTSANAALQWLGTAPIWEMSYEFGIRDVADAINPQDGYLETILDRGLSRSARSGDSDGAGGTISASDLTPEMSPVAPIRDVTGSRTPEPVLLDGRGYPLQSSGIPGIFFRWRIHPTAEFAGLPLDIFT